MAIIVTDCPRCRSKNMTFDVLSSVVVRVEYDWLPTTEAFCVCRNCQTGTIFIVRVTDHDFAKGDTGRTPHAYKGSLNPFIDEPSRYICIRDMGAQAAPEHVPSEVANAFTQGTTCVAVECWDAAAAMFRKAIDLATKPLVPQDDEEGLNARVRRDLGLRLPWLFRTGRLPGDLQHLSTCIREDGNDGAHSGQLERADAADVMDFTRALFERLYTQPERIKIAEARRTERRKPK